MSVCEEDEELQSWGWTDLSSSLWDSQKEHQDLLMSRRSLRLDEGLLDRSLPHSSASFSVGGASWRSNRPLKCRRAQHLSASCSESLLLASPPRRAASLLSSSLHSVASDASLLSSLLDESSVQESTVVDTFWGLDQDIDPKESTIVADQSSLDPDDRCPKHLVQTLSRVPCKDCEHQSVSTNRSSSKYTSSSEPEASTIYCRDRSRRSKTDVLQLWFLSSLLCVRRAAAGCVSVLTHTWQVCRHLFSQTNRRAARSGLCGVMDLKESTTTQKELHPNGSLSDAYKRLNRRWRHMTSGFLLTGFPLLLLVVLLPLLLLFFSLCWFGPAALRSVLPAVDVTERGPLVSGLSSVGGFLSFQSRPAEGAVEEREVQPPAAGEEDGSAAADEADGSAAADGSAVDGSAVDEADGSAAADGSVRLGCLEESLAELWGHVEAGGQRADQRHQELLQLYADLQQLVSDQRHGEEQQPWMTALLDQKLDQKLDQLGKGLDEDRRLTEKQDSFQQQSETSRLDLLELQLQTLAARTEEVQWSREAAATVSPSSALVAAGGGGVDRQSHDALLAEVARLQEALEEVRRDVEGLSVCQDGCRRLDTIQQTISAQVREEVRVLVYGNRVGGDGAPGLPEESLLWWLSQHHVSGSDLQEALLSLELSILQNVRLQLEQHRDEEPVRDAAGTAVTQEDVQETVKNALRLFSQDRTGLADFALESGGGSILSTRCSETYETKAALLSLFGLPLWYFSQSPRVVIQPHVQPGNCWAFRGSTGVLVIRLSMRILPTAVTMEHIPRTLAPSGTLTSAPRDFTVYGLEGEAEVRGKLLGSFTFDQDGEALQSYRLTEENDVAFQIIEVQVLSNWGHQEYTCMYRFRVHGTPEDPRDVQSADLRDGRVLAADGVSSH